MNGDIRVGVVQLRCIIERHVQPQAAMRAREPTDDWSQNLQPEPVRCRNSEDSRQFAGGPHHR